MENKKKKIKFLMSGFAFRMVSGIVLWFLLFAIIVSTIGFVLFTKSLTREYNDSAFRTAESAAMLVNGDKIDEYMEIERGRSGAEGSAFISTEYADYWSRMNVLCQKQNVTLIYVIKVDTSDYGRFEAVFNTVNESSGYDPWAVGYQKDTTNEEYRKVYREIYENGLEHGTVVRNKNLKGSEAHITSLIPIKNSSGEVSAILCVERPMEELTQGRWEYVKNILIATLLLMVASCVCLALYIKRHFAKPVETISEETTRFSQNPFASDKLMIDKNSEIREIRTLAESIDKMEHDTLLYMDELTRATAERERMAVELSLAATIQTNMLPSTFPPYPHRKDFDIFALMDAAKDVGGDFYDFYILDNDRLVILVADVSGKGIPAALFMMRAKMTIKTLAEGGADVHMILSEANERLCEGNEAGMFVTAWIGIVDMKSGVLSYANAGHNPPLIRRHTGSFEYLKTRPNFILAGMEGTAYRNYEIQLLPGDELFLYTDGVTEATNTEKMMFGEERLLDILNSAIKESAESRCRSVKKAISEFVGGAEQFDDITMLSVRFNTFQNDESITTPADVESHECVWDFVSNRTKKAGLSHKIINQAQIVVDEIYSNIRLYSGASMARISCRIDSEKMVLEFFDNGVQYDPLSASEPDVTLSLEEREPGGLGLHIVKEMASDISYSYDEGFNRLIITIRFDK